MFIGRQEEVLDLLASVRSNLRNLDCRLHAGTTPDRIEASANNISFVGPCSLIQCAIRSKGFTFEVVRLDRSVTNGSIPLPNKLIKWLLNLLLPKLLKKHLTAVLLPELGTYFELVQEAVAVEGEFKITGPAVSMMDANLGKVSKDPLQAAALQQLKLSEEQGSAVASLFGTKLGLSRTKAKHVTISELCRYYSRYKPHRVAWAQLEALWEEAIKMHCKGASEPPTFPQLMREVKRLRRHPIKVHVALNTLHFGLNLDVGIRTLGRALSRLSKKSKEKKDGGSVRSGGSENASESASEAGEDEDTAHEAISKWQAQVDGADLNSMLADVLNVNFFFAPPEDDQERAAYMLDVACSGIAQACESRGVVKQRQELRSSTLKSRN
eukprot:gene16301-19346_t